MPENNSDTRDNYKAQKKYMQESRENLNLCLAKGTKERWRKFAEDRGISLTQYIIKLIEEDNRDD